MEDALFEISGLILPTYDAFKHAFTPEAVRKWDRRIEEKIAQDQREVADLEERTRRLCADEVKP